MASSGPNSPGTAANNTAYGTTAWTDVNNVKASDGNVARTQNMFDPVTSNYLQASDFGFSIPSGATIDGILVEAQIRDSSGSGVYDSSMRIVKGGSIGSTNKASVNAWPTTMTYRSYGGSSDKWGETWSASDINDSDFGFVMSAGIYGAFGGASVDHIRITVTYTEGGGSPSGGVPRQQMHYARMRQ